MNTKILATISLAVMTTVSAATSALALCPPSCAITGGGDETQDCHSEFASTAMRLNSPFFNPSKPKPAKEVRCFDGDPGCDLDGQVNNACVFDVDVCLRNADPDLPSCAPADVTAYRVKGTGKFPGLASLQSAVDALVPVATNTCTVGEQIVVPLKGPTSKGEFKAAKANVKMIATTASGDDKDRLKLVCVPHRWPSHGYDAGNRRSTDNDTSIGVANVASLVQRWDFPVVALGGGRVVTSTPTVGRKLVYTTAWDGILYAIKKKNGKKKWEYDTGTKQQLGVQSSATLTADGRVIVGDSAGILHALDAKKGKLLWTATVGDTDPTAAHIWASPTVANNRVFMGRASHNDAPCTQGTLYSFDLDTGAELWRQVTVPDKVCFDDTAVECSTNGDCTLQGSPCLVGLCNSDFAVGCATNADCPPVFLAPGECVFNECGLDRSTSCSVDGDCPACVAAVGGGITATAAVDESGESVYAAAVGCLSYPSVGSSDSIFKIDAATGAIVWTFRTRSSEQFADGPAYQDYGFLNGPILADVDDGLGGTVRVAVAGGKDGTIYAVDEASGLSLWSNELVPPPDFAAFGLFNGAVAFSGGDFYATLFSFNGWPSTNDHLYAFNGQDGSLRWTDQIGASWGDATVVNGVLYVGTQSASELYAYDVQTGSRIHTFTVPGGTVTGGVAVENGVLYVPYGDVFGSNSGGVIAFGLP